MDLEKFGDWAFALGCGVFVASPFIILLGITIGASSTMNQHKKLNENLSKYKINIDNALTLKLQEEGGRYSIDNLPKNFTGIDVKSCSIITNEDNEQMVSFLTEYDDETLQGAFEKGYAVVNLDLNDENAKRLIDCLESVVEYENKYNEKEYSLSDNKYFKKLNESYIDYYDAIVKAIQDAKLVEFQEIAETSSFDRAISMSKTVNNNFEVTNITPVFTDENKTFFYVDMAVKNSNIKTGYESKKIRIDFEGELSPTEAYESFMKGEYSKIVELEVKNQSLTKAKQILDELSHDCGC